MKKNICKNILETLKDSAVMLLIFIACTILVTSILFFCHISITNLNVGISLICTILLGWKLNKNKEKYKVIASSIMAILVFMASIIVCIHTYDLSWDGNTYHKLAVGMLRDGWNPVYQKADQFIKEDAMKSGIEDDGLNSIWIEHYPKASWIFAANIYSMTNDIEGSKIINFLMIYITFALAVNYLYKKTNLLFAVIIAGLIAINPISSVQIFNYYIDGLMGLCLYIIFYALLSISEKSENKNKLENFVILSSVLLIIINLKFTGLIYAAVFCFMFFCLWIYRAYKANKLKEKLLKLIGYYFTVVFVSIFIVGYSSYVKNMIYKGNPLFPLMGENKVDIITYNQPKCFTEMGPLKKFCISLFGISKNITAAKSDGVPQTKIPFLFTNEEIQQYKRPDLRISGFGFLFSGIFIISFVIIIFYFYKFFRKKEFEKLFMLISFSVISLILVIITDGSWWARYVPYLYLFPIVSVIMSSKEKRKGFRILTIAMCTLLMINVGLIMYVNTKEYFDKYRIISTEMKNMKKLSMKNGKVEISLNGKNFSSALYNLKDKNINVKKVNVKNLKKPKYINYFRYGR